MRMLDALTSAYGLLEAAMNYRSCWDQVGAPSITPMNRGFLPRFLGNVVEQAIDFQLDRECKFLHAIYFEFSESAQQWGYR